MKITETNVGKESQEFKFDNGAWVCISIDDSESGSWEYQSDEDDEETYSEGGLWFLVNESKWLVDYDGCYELPEEVVIALKELGYKVEV